MRENETVEISKGARVTYLITAAHKDAKRAEQARTVEAVMRNKLPLSADFYMGALLKKLIPLISVFFADVDRVDRTKADLALLPGQRAADQAVREMIARLDRGTYTRRRHLPRQCSCAKRRPRRRHLRPGASSYAKSPFGSLPGTAPPPRDGPAGVAFANT